MIPQPKETFFNDNAKNPAKILVWRERCDLVLICEHDSQDAAGDLRVGRIGAVIFVVAVIIIDLPEYLSGVSLIEGAEVMLTVWVVALIEVIEAPDLGDDVLADCIGQRVNACGQYDLAGDESAPQHVVQFADGGEDHCEPPSSSVTGRMN